MRVASRAIFWTLVGAVVLSPLPFASVYPWSWSLLACIVGVLMAMWTVRVVAGWESAALGLKSTWFFVLPFALAALWAVIQTSTSITPAHWHHPLWESAAKALGVEVESSISLDRYKNLLILTRILTYGAVFWLSLQYCRQETRARQAIYAVAIAGLCYAAYGLVVQFSGSKTILWFDKFAYEWDLTSTFVNRNSYATYAGLGLICTTGLGLTIVSESLRGTVRGRERIRQLLENLAGRAWILLAGWVVIITALIMSHSRAGFFSTIIALFVLIVAMGLTRAVRGRSAAMFGALCVVGLGIFFLIGGEDLDRRLARTSILAEERPKVYSLTLEAVQTSPLLGTGLGTFPEVFRFYRTPDLTNFYLKAHNTYLENALELGVPAAVGIFVVFAGFLVLTFRGLRRRRMHAVYPGIGFSATVLVAVHSLVDFSLQNPAVSLTYALVMGAACAQSWSSRKSRDPW